MRSWKTLARDIALQHSPYLRVENHTIRLPDDRVLTRWPWLEMRDYVIVAVETAGGQLLIFRQTKYGVEGDTLALVGGYVDPGEEPLAAAQRELREETGYISGDWLSLGSYRVDGNHGAGTAHLYLARRAHFAGRSSSDDLEEQELLELTPTEAAQALERGEFKVLAWTACLALALPRLETH